MAMIKYRGNRLAAQALTLEYVKWLLDYDPETGVFYWKNPNGKGVKPGSVAGSSQDRRGYRQIMINGRKYKAEKLAWFYMHGEWPERLIRFNDGNIKNTRFSNLRYGEFHHVTKDGRNAYDREARKRRPDVFRNQALKRDFGITLEEYKKKLVAQNGVCAICRQPETLVRRGVVANLAVDHDHKTGVIRDLLCSDCNNGIERFKEDPERLRSAIAYLECHAAPSADNIIPLTRKEPA
jgi:hypothetical protein